VLVPFIEILQNIFLHVSDLEIYCSRRWKLVTLLSCGQMCGFCCHVCKGVTDWRRVTWIFDNFILTSCPKALIWHWLIWSFKLIYKFMLYFAFEGCTRPDYLLNSGPKFKHPTPLLKSFFGAFVCAPYKWLHNNVGNFCKLSGVPQFVTINYFSCSFPNKYKHNCIYFENYVNNSVGCLLQRFFHAFIPCGF
jgi:hypothetical protein